MNRRTLLQILFTLIIFGLVLYLASLLSGEPKRPEIERSNLVKVAQYSDRFITENAKNQDRQLKHLAFADSPEFAIYPDQVATVFRALGQFFEISEESVTEEHGTWVWTPILQMTPQYMAEIISGAKAEGVNVVYLAIDSYLDIFVLPDDQTKSLLEADFTKQLEHFVWLAQESGVKVDAVAGWRNWAEPGHTYKPLAIARFVKKFNDSQFFDLRGLQYDVEPYLLPEYEMGEDQKKRILANLVKLVDDTAYFLGDANLKLSVVVPDFYDRQDRLTPEFEYKGRKDFAFGHLLRILDDRPESSLVIMSYRNFAEGENGSIAVSKNEMQTARRGRYRTEIVIAQETGQVEPAFLTFHNTSKEYFETEVGKLKSAFADHRNFAGLAIHYANAYLELGQEADNLGLVD